MGNTMQKGHEARAADTVAANAAFRAAMAGVHNENRSGYADLFSMFSRPLAATAKAYGSESPNDVTNRVFVTAFASLDRVAGERLDFVAYLYTLLCFELQMASLEDTDQAVALRSLTWAQREVLCLSVFFGLRRWEVAKATNRSIETVNWLQDRADVGLRSSASQFGPSQLKASREPSKQ